MTQGAAIGAANDTRATERVATVELRLPGDMGAARLPSFWPDADVRRFLIAEHRFLTIDMARSALLERVGTERTPHRSAIGRFWQLLDRFWARS